MGKNDLLSEDDFFTLNDKNENPSDEPDIRKTTEEEDLFKELEFDRPDPVQNESGAELVVDELEDQPVPISTPDEQDMATPELPAEKTKETTSTYRYEFEDNAQDRVNYKPVIIWIFVIAILVVIGYFAWNYFTGDKEPVVVEEVQQGPSPEEIARANFYSSLTGKTHYHNAQISKIMSITSNKNRLSSLMLYENDFVFEVFSKDRAALARYLRELQNKFGASQVTLNTTTDRPGSSGGVFGLFNLSLDQNGTDKAEVTEPCASVDDVKAWLNDLAGGNSLQIGEIRTSSIDSRDIYRGTQVEATFKGGIDGLSGFMNQFVNSNKNVIIHKLSLISTDLRNYNPKKYQLKLILKVYM